ncbi:MAG: hypothetical protein Q7S57_04010 [bacterium]|nr:hypothetical protein [bacterium]
MANKYGIPDHELEKIRQRDKMCVYCHKKMVFPCVGDKQRNWATIEHLNILPPWNNAKTVVICCGSCNSSRGQKILRDWFDSDYCKEKNINEKTVAQPVRDFLALSKSR